MRFESPRPAEVLIVVQADARDRLLNALIDSTQSAELRYSVVTLSGTNGPLWRDMEMRRVAVRSLGLGGIRLWDIPIAALKLARVFRDLRPDVVHCVLFYGSLATELARAATRNPPPSVLARHHNRMMHIQRKRLHCRLDRWMANHASRVIAVSGAVRDTLIAEGVRPNQIAVVYNGLDWDTTVRSDPVGVESWRRQFPSQRLVVAVGRITLQKDYPTLLQAFARALTKRPDLHLLIAGTGSASERAELHALVDRAGLSESVTLCGWVQDVYDLIAAADVFLHAAIDESFSQVVVEATAFGVPVATTTVGALPEVLGPGYGSVPAGDAGALAGRLLSSLDAGAEAKVRTERLALEMRERFTAKAMAAGYVTEYMSLLSRKPVVGADGND